MKKTVATVFGSKSSRIHMSIIGAIAITLSFFIVPPASAFEIDTGNDVKLRWDTNFKYSAAMRVKERSDSLVDANHVNNDDGDRNFNRSFISNRFDIFSEVDVKYHDVGFHASGAAWYDTIYNTTNSNDSPGTVNSYSVSPNEFTKDTRNLMGRYAELLDAFVFANGAVNEKAWNVRAGRHTLLWGESLLFPNNGISYGQAPLDFVKFLTVPGTQSKELFMPVTQVSGQIQPIKNVTLMAFYQFEWRKSRIPPAGSYLSDLDILDKGGERLLIAPIPGPGFASFYRGSDLEAKNSGQWGVGTRFRLEAVDTDFGLYYIRFNDKNPEVYLTPSAGPAPAPGGLSLGQYTLVYGEDVETIGASFGTQVGPANVSGEFSMRRKMPLVSTPQVVLPGMSADNDKNPLYAVGKTLHAQLSSIYLLPPTMIWQGGTFLGEIAWNRLSSITKNPNAYDTTRQRDAYGLRFVLEPAYYQVLPKVDLTVPIVLGYNPRGKSSSDAKFNGGADQGGDVGVGLTVTHMVVWKYTLNYTNYFGHEESQTLKDRNFIAFSVSRTI